MPVRRNTIINMVNEALGGPFMWTYGELRDQKVTQEEWDATYKEAELAYVGIVSLIDWNRITIEANCRCITLDHKHTWRDATSVCGESIREALLVDETLPKWEERPYSPV